MISVLKAKEKIVKNTDLLSVERLDFRRSLGRILAQDITATSDWPPFSRSTMDGFAFRSSDVKTSQSRTPVRLMIIGESKAGQPFSKAIGSQQAVRMNTGAVLPLGSDCVIKKEDARVIGNALIINFQIAKGQHCRFKGQDAKKGDLLIRQGAEITPGVIALLANLGIITIKVFKIPRVGILTTGNELIGLRSKPRPGQIRSANEYALSAQIKQLGAKPIILGRASDRLASIVQHVKKGLGFDVLLVSGGVSVGDHDFVREALKKIQAREIFWKVAIKPGKPLVFAKKGRCHIFGLPGNTVSSMVSLLTFVRPCLFQMSGRRQDLSKTAEAFLEQDVIDQDPREKIMRGIVTIKKDRRVVRLSTDQISENVMSMAKANCMINMLPGVAKIKKDESVEIEYL